MTKHIQNHPFYARAQEWTRLISITGSAQIGIQAMSLVCGIFVIRYLSTEEYALYTLANTMLGTIIILANAGIPTGVMAEGGRVWMDKAKLGVVFASGFELRRKFGIVSLIICVPILIYLLRHNNASWLTTILIIVGIIPAFFAQISNSILEIAPKLTQDITRLQKNELGINIGRLLLLIPSMFIFPFAYIAIYSATIPQVVGNRNLKKITNKYVDWEQSSSLKVKKSILQKVKRILPEAIFYCLSGQITVWLLSIFGSTNSIAQIGALGRLAMVIGIISVLFGTLITPRFARLKDDFNLLLRRYWQALILVLFALCFVVLVVYLFPSQILWILGSDYANLEREVVLAIIGSCLSIFSGIISSLYSSRGWIINPIFYITISIVSTVIGIVVTDISTLYGVLILNIIVAGVQVLTHFIYGLYRLKAFNSI
ncbi:MAG TPA: polysaccharide biosynthesis protein [Leeuwenhoekiella sp.]|nr:polysaccharide biosynthesis protein [Leeuwenhoekiella sp.]